MSGEVELTFLHDGGQRVSDVAGRLCAFLSRARSTVEIACYDYHFAAGPGEAIAAELQRLHGAGVRVRVCDHDERSARRASNVPRPAEPPEYVDSLGLDVRPVTSIDALMHQKYVVVDAQAVWTGSLNWTDDAFTRQENCIVTVESGEVAAAYLRDFEELWRRREVEGSGDWDAPWSRVRAARLRPIFCPGRGPELATTIATAIRCARRAVHVCSPVLTSGPILGALSDVLSNGRVPVRGVVDETQMAEVLRQWRDLPQVAWKTEAFRYVARAASFGGKRSTPYAPGAMHDYLHAKLVVCDDTLFAGSFNHSRSGEENAENVLQIESAALAREASAFVESAADRYRRPGSDAGW